MSARLDRFGVPALPSEEFTGVLATSSGVAGNTDVTECDREPISVPESIQPHGALLLLDEPDLTIRRASANVTAFVGVEVADLIGAPLSRALGPDGADIVAEQVRRVREGRIGPLVLPLTGSAAPDPSGLCDLTLHRPASGQVIVEIEQNQSSVPAIDVASALLRLQAAPDLAELLNLTALEVARTTGFDRVMLYRFNAEGDGTVVAEEVADGQESYLGLHYPGSDIPRQARELYRRQWLRLIVSSDYVPSPLLPAVPTDEVPEHPLDLSHATLRSVSPVHLQYLRNMGVGSSMSMSLVVEDQLWGLILCHGRQRHLVPSAIRTACEQLAQFVSLQIESRWETARLAADLRAQHLRTLLVDQMATSSPVEGLVGGDEVGLLDVLPADAAAGRLRGRTLAVGDGPDAHTTDRLVALVRAAAETGDAVRDGWSTRTLRLDLPAAAQLLDAAGHADIAGVLLAPAPAGEPEDYLLWLRREVEQTVDWAGEPTVKSQSGTLSPRASFALWREKVRDHSAPWQADERDVAAALAESVSARLGRLDEGALAATASHTAELLAREHEIADTLQRGMLPVLPELPHLTLSASYVSAGETAEVGGDWYDVFRLPDGSTGIAMGDVTGHDLSAAATMGQLRSILRSYAWEEPAPERVLDKVDDLVSGFAMQRLATVFFGRLEQTPDGTEFRYANAGHLPPVLRRPDGTAELLDDGVSVLIGVGLGVPHEASGRHIPPGSTLLLYTDGLVERRDRSLSAGIEALRRAVEDGPADADALRSHVLTRLADGRGSDDIAVLVVRLDA